MGHSPFILLQKLFGTFIFSDNSRLHQSSENDHEEASPSPFPAIIEPYYSDEDPLRKRLKKICSIHHSKYFPIPSCPPSVLSDG
jgi:hypothetical protein